MLDANSANNRSPSGSRGRGRSKGRGRGGRRRASQGRPSQGGSNAAPPSPIQPRKTKNPTPLNIRFPRLAKRNLRDQGQLPRRRGPDKPPSQSCVLNPQASGAMVVSLTDDEAAADLEIADEMVSDSEYEAAPTGNISQLDGNISVRQR